MNSFVIHPLEYKDDNVRVTAMACNEYHIHYFAHRGALYRCKIVKDKQVKEPIEGKVLNIEMAAEEMLSHCHIVGLYLFDFLIHIRNARLLSLPQGVVNIDF